MRLPVHLPDTVRNPLSLIGTVVTTTAAVLFAVLLVLDAVGAIANPYLGLLVFVTIPFVFVLGLLLIPLGAWRERRRRRHDSAPPAWPIVDLRQPRHRMLVVTGLALTGVNIVIVSMAAYGGVHYMDSPAFCGQVCHTTMEPQSSAHQAWPHAHVGCSQCHIGPGAGAMFEAKLAGTRQLYHVLTNQVPRPVPPPERLIQPAHETCEGVTGQASHTAIGSARFASSPTTRRTPKASRPYGCTSEAGPAALVFTGTPIRGPSSTSYRRQRATTPRPSSA